MCADVYLRCEQRWLRRRRVVIRKPDNLVGTRPGPFPDPPTEWTRGERLDADATALADWAQRAAGEAIVAAINRAALSEDTLSRVLLSSDDGLREASLAAPWEFLEHSPIRFEAADRLAVVRLLEVDSPPAEPTTIAAKLRVLVLWANPDGDIEEMPAHLEALRALAQAADEKIEVKALEFTGVADVRKVCIGFHPHVVYYIGHGYQPADRRVRLRIGPRSRPDGLDIGQFANLIEEIGLARLIILNACDVYAGADLNPYLGAALQCVPRFESAIGMQTKVPIRAATRFAEELLDLLSDNIGLARAVKKARAAMVQSDRAAPVITRFIPVLIQRTSQDRPFVFDQDAQTINRLHKFLAIRLEQISRLPRSIDEDLTRALSLDGGRSPVAVLTGPPDCGKSTSVRAAVQRLLDTERIKRGERYLYFSATSLMFSSEPSIQVRQLVQAFARDFARVTGRLSRLLLDTPGTGFDDTVAALATWVDEERSGGQQFAMVFDDLPEALLTNLANVAQRVMTSGRLLLVSRSHAIQPESPISTLHMDSMSDAELIAAMPERSLEDIRRLREETNGIPYLVASVVRDVAPASAFLDHLLYSLSDDEQDLLELAALANLPLTPLVLTELQIDPALATMMVSRLLLMETAEGAWLVPGAVRRAVSTALAREDEFAQRGRLFNAFVAVAEREKTNRFRRPAVVNLYTEAFHQGVSMIQLDTSGGPVDDVLTATKDVAIELHYQHLERGHERDETLAIWEHYRRVATAAGRADERDVDLRFARCLAAVGRLEEADELLRLMTAESIEDDIQIRVLVDRAGVLKRLGHRDAHAERLSALQRAAELHRRLMDCSVIANRGADELLGDIEQSLANVYGYGADADVAIAVTHATRAAEIFERLHDDRRFRARAEVVEIRRYNGHLTPEERREAIEMIRSQAEELIDRSMQHDAVLHLYELGRLETDPVQRARWFRLAVERAEGGYAPTRLHAAIQWRMAEVEAGVHSLNEATPEILRDCNELDVHWREDAWSRRVQRDALWFLARQFRPRDGARTRALLAACWEVVVRIQEYGEGRRDVEMREAVSRELSL
jgi:hypothetical protein